MNQPTEEQMLKALDAPEDETWWYLWDEWDSE